MNRMMFPCEQDDSGVMQHETVRFQASHTQGLGFAQHVTHFRTPTSSYSCPIQGQIMSSCRHTLSMRFLPSIQQKLLYTAHSVLSVSCFPFLAEASHRTSPPTIVIPLLTIATSCFVKNTTTRKRSRPPATQEQRCHTDLPANSSMRHNISSPPADPNLPGLLASDRQQDPQPFILRNVGTTWWG